MTRKLRFPFLFVNPKAYIYGDESVALAKVCDALAAAYALDIIFTCQHADIYRVAQATTNILVAAQHMDGIVPGRGMGHILPESIKGAGAHCVVLNHAEHPLQTQQLDKALARAKELALLTIVAADTPAEARAIATLGPDVMLCEPTSLIGSGSTSPGDYVAATNAAVRSVNKEIMILQAAGVSGGDDVYRLVMAGADGSGATSGILNAPDRREKIAEMLEALLKARRDVPASS